MSTRVCDRLNERNKKKRRKWTRMSSGQLQWQSASVEFTVPRTPKRANVTFSVCVRLWFISQRWWLMAFAIANWVWNSILFRFFFMPTNGNSHFFHFLIDVLFNWSDLQLNLVQSTWNEENSRIDVILFKITLKRKPKRTNLSGKKAEKYLTLNSLIASWRFLFDEINNSVRRWNLLSSFSRSSFFLSLSQSKCE